MDFQDVLGFKAYLNTLPSGSSVLVAWEHKMMGRLAQAVDPEGLAPAKYPDHCKSEWTEPEYTMGACYDVIWQFVLYRSHSRESWRAKAFFSFADGLCGWRLQMLRGFRALLQSQQLASAHGGRHGRW